MKKGICLILCLLVPGMIVLPAWSGDFKHSGVTVQLQTALQTERSAVPFFLLVLALSAKNPSLKDHFITIPESPRKTRSEEKRESLQK